MPLIKGTKPGSKGFKENIREMYESGHPLKQSIAAAYSAAGEHKAKPTTTKDSKMKEHHKEHKKEHHKEHHAKHEAKHEDHKHMHHHHSEMHKHHAKELKHHEKMMSHHMKHAKKK